MSNDYEKFFIQLRGASGEIIDAEVETRDEGDDSCTLFLRFRDHTYTASADDYFDALCEIRSELAKERIVPLCYGASRNVYPSGMCRDMGRGLTGYKMTLGQKARQKDLVGIFQTGPDVEPGSVDEQKAFRDLWGTSLTATT